jgi:hypothetical protein
MLSPTHTYQVAYPYGRINAAWLFGTDVTLQLCVHNGRFDAQVALEAAFLAPILHL